MAASLKSECGVSHGHPFTHLLHKGSVSSGDWYKDTLQYYYIQWWCDTMQGDLMVLWQCLVIQYYILQWLLHFTVCYTCICMWWLKNLNPEETQLHQIFKKLSWRLQLKSTSGSMIQCNPCIQKPSAWLYFWFGWIHRFSVELTSDELADQLSTVIRQSVKHMVAILALWDL